MPKFKVIAGRHVTDNPEFGKDPKVKNRHIVYERGQVVESEDDLDKVFVNKFDRLPDSHYIADRDRKNQVNSLIESGSFETGDRAFLEGMQPGDFQRLHKAFKKQSGDEETTDQGTPKDPAKGAVRKELGASEEPAAGPPKESPLGEDVTDSFPKVKKEGMHVFRNAAGKHSVTTAKELGKPLNPQPLEGPKVDAFFDKYQKESKG
jgi:hypothetical protein